MSTSTQTATSAKKYNLLITLIILLAPIALSVVPQSYAASPDLVISQVYGGGGNSGAPYTHDFIELFNRGSSAVSLDGLSLQYASATGTGNFGNSPTAITELPDVTLQPGQYFLVAEVSGSNGVALPTPDFIDDSSAIAMGGTGGKIALVNGTAGLGCNGSSAPCNAEQLARIIDLVGYGNANFYEGSGPTAAPSNTTAARRLENGCKDTDNNSADFEVVAPSPRNSSNPLNPCGTPETPETPETPGTPETPEPGVCPTPTEPLISIAALQGTGDVNTVNNAYRTVRGVVVADFQDSLEMSGFFIQDPVGDDNPLTSEGLFVYVPSGNTLHSFDVSVGEAVQVTGRVTEYQGMTEMDNVSSIVKCGTNTIIEPVELSLPEAYDGDLERYEGMLVEISQPLTVNQSYFLGRYGQLTLSSGGRLYQPTNFPNGGVNDSSSAYENSLRLIVLDDATTRQNPAPIPYIGEDNTIRGGDTTVGSIVGVIDYGPINSDSSIRDYRIQPVAPVTFSRQNPRTAAPDPVGGNVKVASFNVLNYFTTLDVAGSQCYPTNSRSDCRGADSTAEFERQSAKIVSALQAINADVVGLIEIENNGATAINDLVSRLNTAIGGGTYAAIADPVGIGGASPYPGGGDAVKVALIYKSDSVTPIGSAVAANDPAFSQGRAPVAQTFEHIATGERFSVVVNHFKSKRCDGASGNNNDLGDGQGCWNELRVSQANALLNFIATLSSSSGDTDVLVIGDLNSYGSEDPIVTLTSNGLVNQIQKHIGNTAYSYVFDGQAGYIDHALTTSSLDAQVSGVTIWHINSDEPSVIDYNTEFKPQDLYTNSPYYSSDHDPVIVGLNLGETATPTPTTPTTTPTPTTPTPTTPTPTPITPTPTPTRTIYLPVVGTP